MQAISVRQPWAWAIARGHKGVENRVWTTGYRGPLVIHASMRVDLAACDWPLIRAAGWETTDRLAALGAVVAVADLTGVCAASVESQPVKVPASRQVVEPATSGEAAEGCDCGEWAAEGNYHWQLANVVALPRPIVTLGRLGLWEPSAVVLSAIRDQLDPERASTGRSAG